MRQQTTNTFDKGLNTDLNPIVTPNDVLTDCLNGTFLTFNGDELVLQNDAGNTTVNIPDSSELYKEGTSYDKGSKVYVLEGEVKHYYKSIKDSNTEPVTNDQYWEEYFPIVTLSEGFHPIGMKEYGGVLYIASGKHGNIGTVNGEGKIIQRGDPDAEEDLIEFGSYPSPMFAKPVRRAGLNTLEGYGAEDFYKAITINELDFRSGGYVQFASANPEVTYGPSENLWTPTNPNGFYIIRLIHQFDTGSFDLTELIWKKYTEFLETHDDEPNHWIDSNNFKFFCPNRYKGKLAIVIDINEPTHFELAAPPTTTFVDPNFKLDIYIDMDRRIEGEKGLLCFLGYKVDLEYNDGETVSYLVDAEDDTKPVLRSSFFIPNNKKHASYTITPITNYEWEILPIEFRDKFTLRGSIFLEDRYLDLYFVKKEGICMEDEDKKGIMQYKVLLLGDGVELLGEQELNEGFTLVKIDPEIDPENGDKPIAFYLKDSDSTLVSSWNAKYLKRGEFEVDEEGRVTIVEDNAEYTTFKNSLDDSSKEILKVFESLQYSVEERDTTCDIQYMTIIFDKEPSNPSFYWDSQPFISAIVEEVNSKEYKVAIMDMDDVLRVTAFGVTRLFRILRLPGGEYNLTYEFTIPAPKIFVLNPPTPTCTMTRLGNGTYSSTGVFTFPSGGQLYYGDLVSIKIVYSLQVLEGYMQAPSNSSLTVSVPGWNVINKTVSTVYTPRDLGGGTMECTLNISLSTPLPPPPPWDPYDAPGYPTEDPIRMESMLNFSTNLNVKSVLGDAQTNNTISMRISGVKVSDINY